MTINKELECVLNDLLQSYLVLKINGKSYRKGRFVLYKHKNFYLTLILKLDNDKIKKVELPIPYNIERWDADGLVYFDYRFTALAQNNKPLLAVIKKLPKTGNNKFYNSILEIKEQI